MSQQIGGRKSGFLFSSFLTSSDGPKAGSRLAWFLSPTSMLPARSASPAACPEKEFGAGDGGWAEGLPLSLWVLYSQWAKDETSE